MARYHVNAAGNPGVCRAQAGGCPFGGTEAHYDSRKDAQAAFEASMSAFGPKSASLPEHRLEVFHGSSQEFDSFDPNFAGRGNDSWGSGFYFSTLESVAGSYGKAKPFTVTLANPLVADGFEHMSLNHVRLDPQQTAAMLKLHPDIHRQPTDESMANPLSDWAPEFWDKDEHTEEEMDAMMDSVAKQYFSDGASFTDIEHFYHGKHATAFRHALREVTGWDGVIVNFKDEDRDGRHVVAWFPEQIQPRA